MRKFGKKRYVAVMTAMAMAASMMGSMSAMAAKVSVSIDYNGKETDIWGTNPEFTAYRVFTGINNSGKLTNIEWSTEFVGLATNSKLLELVYGKDHKETEVTAEKVAAYLAGTTNQTDTPEAQARAKAFAKIANSIVTDATVGVPLVTGTRQELDAGYYLIVNTTIGNSADGTTSGVRNPIVMEVTSDGDIVIKAKTDRPSVVKKIWEERREDQTANTTFEIPGNDVKGYINGIDDSYQWNDVADYDIGDEVPFKLVATIPAYTTTDYPEYKVVFQDTMDSNLQRDADVNNYLVYAQLGTGDLEPVDSAFYSVSFPADEGKINIEFPNIKGLTGFAADQELKLYVFFTAELKSSAVAATGEENEVVLKFSNDYTTNGTGTTVKDQVVAITFDTIIDKYTETKTATDSNAEEKLAGAKFKLYRVRDTSITTMDLNTVKVGEDTVDNKIYEIYDLTDAATLANLELVSYSTDSGDIINVDKNGQHTTFTTTGKNLKVHGLDRGQYLLVETKAPAGYNILKEAKKIDITNTNPYNRNDYRDGEYKNAIAYDVTFEGERQENGIVKVLNNAGSELPETGGAGTMALYIVGTLLMAGSVFFLTAKGRRKEELE